MSYLVGKILLCLIVALLCGFALGWLLWRSISRQSERELADRWERRFGELERERDTRIAKLRREVEDHREQIPTLETSLAERSDLIAQLESDLVAWREKTPQMEERLASKDSELSTLRNHADEYARKLAALDGEIAERDSQIATLRATSDGHKRALAEHEKSSAAALAQVQALQAEVEKRDRALAQERAASAQAAQSELESRLQGHREQRDALRAQLEVERKRAMDNQRRVQALEAELAEAKQARPGRSAAPRLPGERPASLLSVAPAPGQGDDLKKIRGVGPVMEATMNGLGVYFFRQLAELTEAEIRWLAEHINTFPDRIERDQWVAQAAQLQEEKYGGRPATGDFSSGV